MEFLNRNDRWADTPVPPSIANPPFAKEIEWICIIGGGLIILWSIINSFRAQRLTYGFLFLINSMLCYWMETIGDWGQHLVYSPQFMRHRFLEWLPLKSPNDPIFLPFAYANYWTAHSIMLMYFAPILQRYWKHLSLLQAVLIVSLPLNYAFDILVEGPCTYMGWWTYDPGMGPVIKWPGGGRQPLTWPILLMSVWPNLIAYWGGKPPLTHLNIMERWFGLERWTEPNGSASTVIDVEEGLESTPLLYPATKHPNEAKGVWSKKDEYDRSLDYRVISTVPRWLFELARFGSWFVVFQVSFFITLIIPLVGLRKITGRDSIYVP